jgi:hypothetical protein
MGGPYILKMIQFIQALLIACSMAIGQILMVEQYIYIKDLLTKILKTVNFIIITLNNRVAQLWFIIIQTIIIVQNLYFI